MRLFKLLEIFPDATTFGLSVDLVFAFGWTAEGEFSATRDFGILVWPSRGS
jgi:hypothetical protein